MKKLNIFAGMNLRLAIVAARLLGASVTPVNKTGEIRFAADGLRPVVQDARRKDATRAVVAFLYRVARTASNEPASSEDAA